VFFPPPVLIPFPLLPPCHSSSTSPLFFFPLHRYSPRSRSIYTFSSFLAMVKLIPFTGPIFLSSQDSTKIQEMLVLFFLSFPSGHDMDSPPMPCGRRHLLLSGLSPMYSAYGNHRFPSLPREDAFPPLQGGSAPLSPFPSRPDHESSSTEPPPFLPAVRK